MLFLLGPQPAHTFCSRHPLHIRYLTCEIGGVARGWRCLAAGGGRPGGLFVGVAQSASRIWRKIVRRIWRLPVSTRVER